MSETLKKVFEKGRTDMEFLGKVLVDPAGACQGAGIELNRTEIKVLGDAMGEVRKCLLEKLFVISSGPEILWNGVCGIGQAGCIG